MWLPRRGRGGGEEIPRGTSAIEDVENKGEHTLLNLGSGYEGGGRNELECTLHKVSVSLGRELDPIDKAAVSALGHGDKREEPVPRKEPATMETVDNVEDKGIA
jgi:hypothetical protein